MKICDLYRDRLLLRIIFEENYILLFKKQIMLLEKPEQPGEIRIEIHRVAI